MSVSDPIEFTAIIDDFNSDLWHFHLVVPETIARVFVTEDNDRRVVCTLNGKKTFQCALMPKGDGNFFININKEIRTKLKLNLGSTVEVSLVKDESEYGLPMPEELASLMQIDPEGDKLFHALTPGKQRTLLYIVGKPKNAELRIKRAIAVIDHLKELGGKIDFKLLNVALKNDN